MNNIDQDILQKNILRVLNRSVDELDEQVLLRLNEIRHKALMIPPIEDQTNDELDALILATKVCLDDSSQALDSPVSKRLDHIRKQALAQTEQAGKSTGLSMLDQIRRFFDNRRFAIPVSGFATACVLVTVITLAFQMPNSPRFIDDDIVLLASSDDEIELYENLEFFLWLADNGLAD